MHRKEADPARALHLLEDENEQLRVSLEDLRNQADQAACEQQEMARQLAAARAEIAQLRGQLRQQQQGTLEALRQQLSPSSARLFQESVKHAELEASEEELRIALEEMQVLTEELEDTNAALTLANRELDERVAERTAALCRANEALASSEQRLLLAQSVAAAAAWDWEAETEEFTWSEGFLQLHGMDRHSSLPFRDAWLASLHPEDRVTLERALRLSLERGLPDFSVEYRVRPRGRGERWIATRGRLLLDDHDQPRQLIGLALDITERKQAELALSGDNDILKDQVRSALAEREAAQARMFQAMKLEALGQLTGGVAHDFNNLLAVIISGLSLLSRSRSDAERAKLTDSIDQAARRGAKLVRRLLSFARRQSLEPEALELQGWMTEMAGLLKPSLRPDIEVRIEAAPGIAVLADRAELELAVLNLCLNARDAMPGPGTLTLAARCLNLKGHEDPAGLHGDFIEISVRDTGEGMAEETLTRAFEPFFTTKSMSRGTGLGLPQVYGFAQQSGGMARAESRLGEGTTVRLLLPAAGTPAAAARPEPPAPLPRPERSLRILLVEDDAEVGDMAVRLLHKLGHEVLYAPTAEKGMEALLKGRVDLLFTDIMLAGGGNGLDLALSATQRWPDLPVLLTSGYEGVPERVAATHLPLLRKPYGAEELGRAIAAVLARSGHPAAAGPAARGVVPRHGHAGDLAERH